MSVHDMTEQAYRNGYAKGYQDAKKEERHGRWINDYDTFIKDDGHESEPIHTGFVCSVCGRHSFAIEPYCHCGAIMDLPNITEQTENALRKLGEHREEVDFDYNAED